jgi:glycosyltransferase involved in cell wall biosynthesis
MAAGRPVVATDVGGTQELVESGVSGLLVPPKDPERLSQAIIELMTYPEQQRDAMGAHGKEGVAARYTIDRVVDEWESVLQCLAGATGGVSGRSGVRGLVHV